MYRHKRFFDRFFTIGTTTKDFTHRSLLLNIELDTDNRFTFTLSTPALIEGKSKLSNTAVFTSKINLYIEKITTIKTTADLIQVQSELSSFTDDFLPLNIRKFLLNNKSLYDYIVIEDDSIDFNIPYGILFFPDRSTGVSLSGKGYFLSELYTPIRAIQEKQSKKDIKISDTEINKICVLSSDDLPGSLKEEDDIIKYFNNKISDIAFSIQDENELETELTNQICNLYHFCCHGNKNNEILSNKNGKTIYMDLDFFNMYRFPQSTTIFLNICLSNYTKYDGVAYRSISKKFINREAELVVMTEWPINDDVAFRMGTEFYRRIIDMKETPLVAIHNIKKLFSSLDDKLTAITYSLKGNPYMRISIKN